MQLSKQNKRTIDTLTPVVVAAGVGFVSFRKSKDWRFVVATIIIAWLIAYILTSQVTRFFYLKGPAELPTGAGAETYDALPLTTRLKDEIYSWGFRDDAPYQELLSLNDAQFIKVYNACGKFSLHETADLIRKAKLLVSHDNGWMQMAAALKKPVITVWGSTTPSLGETPYYGENHLANHAHPYDDVQLHKLWCRPCTTTGRNQCPQGHFKCMKKISIEEIVKKVNKRLSLHSSIAHKGFS